MKTSILLILSLLFFTWGEARLGENAQQCADRYGAPIKPGLHQKSGLFIFITYDKAGKCEVIGFRKVNENLIGTADELSDNEIKILLKLNGKDWKEKVQPFKREWFTPGSDGASYDQSDHTLIIFTAAYALRILDEKEQKEKEALKGF